MFKDIDYQFVLKMLFGYLLVSFLFFLGLLVIVKQVTPQNSYGLDGIIHTFELTTTAFMGWLSGHSTAKAQNAANAQGSILLPPPTEPGTTTTTATVTKEPAP